MFIDKLWVRIRGELLTLKDDYLDRDEIREKTETLLDRLDRLLEETPPRDGEKGDLHGRIDVMTNKIERAAHKTSAEDEADAPTRRELEQAWDELKSLREGTEREDSPSGSRPVNPRILG
ncbi:MAG: hypothetical protein V2B18_15580 [Pseudomonadota bacterium]